MTNPESILKSRDITLPTKVRLVKAMVFPVAMYGCESRMIKKAEHQRIDAFELWCWRRHLRVPWTARRSNLPISKSVLNIHWKDWCWNWNSNTLATWCEELIHWKRPWCWERLKVGGEGNDSGWDGWMSSPIRWTWVWASSRSSWWTGKPGMLQSTGSQKVRHDWVTEQATVYCYACMHAKSPQSYLTFCDPMDCSPPSSSVHVILQARILEWVAMPASRGSSQPRDQTLVSYSPSLAGILYH